METNSSQPNGGAKRTLNALTLDRTRYSGRGTTA